MSIGLKKFFNLITVSGSEADKWRFKTDMENCLMSRNCNCNVFCPLTKALYDKSHKHIMEVYTSKDGMDFEVETKNITLQHLVKDIAASYPSLLFQVRAISDSSNEYVEEIFVFLNKLTLLAIRKIADKKKSFLDNCRQIVTTGSRTTTENGGAVIFEEISKENSKIIASVRSDAHGAKAVRWFGLSQDGVTRLNYWDEYIDFLIERMNVNPAPLFETKNVIISDSIVKHIETCSELYAPMCMFLTVHSYGHWGEADVQTVAHNNDALTHGGGVISKFKCFHDTLLVVTFINEGETKMFLASDPDEAA